MTEPVQGDLTAKRDVLDTRRRPPLMWVLVVLLSLEFLAMVGVCIYLVASLFVSHPTSYAGGVAFLVLALVAALWLAYIVVGALRGRAWIRGASIVWQVIQFAIGVGSFEGAFSEPAIGWFLIVPSVAVVVLLLTPSVVVATHGRDRG